MGKGKNNHATTHTHRDTDAESHGEVEPGLVGAHHLDIHTAEDQHHISNLLLEQDHMFPPWVCVSSFYALATLAFSLESSALSPQPSDKRTRYPTRQIR